MRLLIAPILLVVAACSAAEDVPGTNDAAAFPTPKIYIAGEILTMTGEGETAEAIAVHDGEIKAVGDVEKLLEAYPGAEVDATFKGKTILPGLIDPHMHVTLGAMMYGQPFAPPWGLASPDGLMPAYPDRDSFLLRVAEIVAAAPDDDSPVVVYGYHNLVQGDLDRDDLDAINADRPLIVWHYSGHDFYLNTAALDQVGAGPDWAQAYHGIGLNEDGTLNGRIYEDAALHVFTLLADVLLSPAAVERGLGTYFDILRKAGVTTTAELGYGIFGRALEDRIIADAWGSEQEAGFRLYLVPEYRALGAEFGDAGPQAVADMLSGQIQTPAPVRPRVKFFTDGAFYSQTMKLSPPGYLAGQSAGSDGNWVLAPEDQLQTLRPYAEAGYDIHIHSNGDAAQDATLDTLEALRLAGFEGDFVIEHGGLFSPKQVARAADLGAGVSVASHYVFYMSAEYADPLGPARAAWISPVGSLTNAGVPVALHSDAPLAPPQPLRAAGAHVTRMTREGAAYAPEQALSAYEALEAVTLDAARVLGLEDQLGSIAVGKRADLTVLEANPLDADAEDWPLIGVWGVMLDGELRPVDP